MYIELLARLFNELISLRNQTPLNNTHNETCQFIDTRQYAVRTRSKRRITLSMKQTPLKLVLQKIGRQSGYTIRYNCQEENDSLYVRPVNIRVKKVSVEEALITCLRDQPFTYNIVGREIFINARSCNKNKPFLLLNLSIESRWFDYTISLGPNAIKRLIITALLCLTR